MEDPIQLFLQWQSEEQQRSDSLTASTCCLSTLGLDGFPNARFLSLKEVVNEHFIITGPLRSRKALELKEHPRAALTFWWHQTKRQIRIQGKTEPIDEELARKYFSERSRDAQLISSFFEQGKPIRDENSQDLFEYARKQYEDKEVPFPGSWGGFAVMPVRIEFFQFEESRLHRRRLFTKTEEGWESIFLQP